MKIISGLITNPNASGLYSSNILLTLHKQKRLISREWLHPRILRMYSSGKGIIIGTCEALSRDFSERKCVRKEEERFESTIVLMFPIQYGLLAKAPSRFASPPRHAGPSRVACSCSMTSVRSRFLQLPHRTLEKKSVL